MPTAYDDTPTTRIQQRRACNDALAYAPDTAYLNHRPMRYIRVNVHFMNSEDSSKNYWGEEATTFAKNIIGNVNSDLSKNAKMNLPLGNDTPVLPPRYRLRLTRQKGVPNDTGVYCHFDDELYYHIHKGKNRNLHKREVIEKYAIQKDSVVNIFIMPHHPDSIRSKTYSGGRGGVALGTNIKLTGIYEGGKEFWHYRQVLNHEIGHVFGLQHTWNGRDGCDDTPKHNNCWNRTKNGGACDSLVSNNVMDYNAWQLALTPCQIGRVHRSMSKLNSRPRNMLEPTWCILKEAQNVTILDSVSWNGAHDLEGHLIIENGGVLQVNCRISMPPNAEIIIAPGGMLVLNNAHLHNACGLNWKGIVIEEKGNQKGQLILKGKTKLENMDVPIEGMETSNETQALLKLPK